jgi:hypothetical protein
MIPQGIPRNYDIGVKNGFELAKDSVPWMTPIFVIANIRDP